MLLVLGLKKVEKHAVEHGILLNTTITIINYAVYSYSWLYLSLSYCLRLQGGLRALITWGAKTDGA
jgi:hypothetical protein